MLSLLNYLSTVTNYIINQTFCFYSFFKRNTYIYPCLTPKFYTYKLRAANSIAIAIAIAIEIFFGWLKWGLNRPPKPHSFVNLPLQSGIDRSWLNISDSDWKFIVSQLNKLESEIRIRLQKYNIDLDSVFGTNNSEPKSNEISFPTKHEKGLPGVYETPNQEFTGKSPFYEDIFGKNNHSRPWFTDKKYDTSPGSELTPELPQMPTSELSSELPYTNCQDITVDFNYLINGLQNLFLDHGYIINSKQAHVFLATLLCVYMSRHFKSTRSSKPSSYFSLLNIKLQAIKKKAVGFFKQLINKTIKNKIIKKNVSSLFGDKVSAFNINKKVSSLFGDKPSILGNNKKVPSLYDSIFGDKLSAFNNSLSEFQNGSQVTFIPSEELVLANIPREITVFTITDLYRETRASTSNLRPHNVPIGEFLTATYEYAIRNYVYAIDIQTSYLRENRNTRGTGSNYGLLGGTLDSYNNVFSDLNNLTERVTNSLDEFPMLTADTFEWIHLRSRYNSYIFFNNPYLNINMPCITHVPITSITHNSLPNETGIMLNVVPNTRSYGNMSQESFDIARRNCLDLLHRYAGMYDTARQNFELWNNVIPSSDSDFELESENDFTFNPEAIYYRTCHEFLAILHHYQIHFSNRTSPR